MGRRPRAATAAEHRVTIRMTESEATDLQRVAREQGVDVSTLVRQLVQRLAVETDFVDAPVFTTFVRNSTVRTIPGFVFTLHHVPGRARPLCVRRKVVRADGATLAFEFRGRRQWVELDVMRDAGSACTHLDWAPHFRVYDHVPDDGERRAWRQARERLRGRIGRPTLEVWVVVDREAMLVDADESEIDRGRYVFELDEFRYEFSLFDLAWVGHVTAHGQTMAGGYWRARRVYLEEPTPQQVEDEVRRQADEAQHERERDERDRRDRQERTATGEPEPSPEVFPMLNLRWPFTFAEARAAFRRVAFENHPDRGGDQRKMQAVNAEWVRAKALLEARGCAA